MRKTVIIITLLMCSLQLFSQISIKGKVTDRTTGESLPGATVSIEGTTTGTTTNLDGMYTISANSDTDVLVFSFVGYLTQKRTIGQQREINIVLEEDVTELEEVVVTALGIKREKKALGYAVQDVKGDEISETNPANIVSALSGRIAGAHVVTSSGQVGASSTIQIRGNKSLTGSAQPLFVVDGTPIMNGISSARSSSTSTDFGNAAMDIDPSNVESISILKGPSASALYGSRAANGVILITTKKGAGQKGLGVEFSTSLAFDNVYLLPNYQDEYGQGMDGSEYLYNIWEESPRNQGKSYQEFSDVRGFQWGIRQMKADESWGVRLNAGLNVAQMDSPTDPVTGDVIQTPWVSYPNNVIDFYETGISSVNNLALTTQGEKASGRFTMGYSKQKGSSPNTDQSKINLGINTGIKLSEKLSVDVNVNYTNLKNDNLPQTGNSMRNPLLEFNGWFGRQVDTKYLKEHYDDIVVDEGKEKAFNWMMGYPSQHPNPYWNSYKNTMSRGRNRLYGNVSI
ncbi:MAG: carboxypeptidase-like regulatory domain-containing protein, partial [Bacteroidota bacterium]|nr:carboxypeptidase-like regulatory domain-containing protein [Bacteroidota bacterium]